MSNQITIGDWVVAGKNVEELDLGQILSIDGNEARVSWQSGALTPCDLASEDVEVFGRKATAEARYEERNTKR